MQHGLILTGASGFIGINLLLQFPQSLRNRYDRVISIDKLGYATIYNQDIYFELCGGLKIESIGVNMLDLSKHIKFEKDYMWDVINFAAESHVDNSIQNPYGIYEENSLIPSRLLAAFEDIASIRRFYHISTDEVYGSLPLSVKKKEWFDINSSFKPNNPYSASKVAQDSFLLSMKHTFGLPLCVFRLANQFGNFQHPEKMLPASCLRVYKNEPIKIYGKGLNKRQWTPVSISTKIIIDKLEKLDTFDVLHIANKNGLLNNNYIADVLIDTIQQSTNCVGEKVYIEDRKGHDLCYALKTTPEIDEYFKDVKIEYCLASTAEFYFLNKEKYSGK